MISEEHFERYVFDLSLSDSCLMPCCSWSSGSSSGSSCATPLNIDSARNEKEVHQNPRCRWLTDLFRYS